MLVRNRVVRPVGLAGTPPTGVADASFEVALPSAFTARMRKVCGVPLVRPPTGNCRVAPLVRR